MPPSIRSEIAIIGAGPAGATAAIALARKGIPALLIDKYQFPRRKICGDGLSGKVVSNLNRLAPFFVSELSGSGFATKSQAVRFYSPNLKMMELSFQPDQPSYPPGFICKRRDFDHFLLGKALTFNEINFKGGIQISELSRVNGWIKLKDPSDNTIAETRLVIFAAGSDKKLIRQLDPAFPNPSEEGIGVRGYFDNVTGADQKHAIEIHFLKEVLPWYLWIFPFSDGSANVGLALPGSLVVKTKLNLKDLLFHLIQSYPHLRKRFTRATLQGRIEAGRLSYYTGPCPVAGDNYMLLGDAARLIDPFTGEGIGNAMYSGRYAAETASKCIENRDFSFESTNNYQQLIDSRLGPELALSLKLQRLARKKHLLNLVIGKASRNENTRKMISEMLYSRDVKLNLNNPLFYIKILLGI